jgi:hypothetical protein
VGTARAGVASPSVNSEVNTKVMSLKQLKEVISEIFNEKFKHDQRCMEAKAPMETMEQFLYTYLSKKYGLKVRNTWLTIFIVPDLISGLPGSDLSEIFPEVGPRCGPLRKNLEKRM